MSDPEHLNRKRRWSKCEDGGCDFVPLSKRINNLHLDRPTGQEFHGQCTSFGHQPLDGVSPEQAGMFGDGAHQWGTSSVTRPSDGFSRNSHASQQGAGEQVGGNNVAPWLREQIMAQYAPVLTEQDNPYYYENNKMLFALFMERLQRISPT